MNDWITKQELEEAKSIASKIYKDFCSDICLSGEQEWTEIEINGKFFDLDCFDDDMEKPRTETYCNIHATYPTKVGACRETDGEKFIRLFTNGVIKNER
tara:strand:- start:152 stop:448 length:297 start_codon:yes stop_codon:yes gene_type:complete